MVNEKLTTEKLIKLIKDAKDAINETLDAEIKIATETIKTDEDFYFSEVLTKLLGYEEGEDGYYVGVIVTLEDGEVKFSIDGGEVYPPKYTRKGFYGVLVSYYFYGD